MKKLLVLVALVTTMSVSVASAKDFNGARWQWFYSNSDYTGKVDLDTLSYNPETDSAKAWAVWVRSNGRQQLTSYDIYFENNSMDVGQYYIYQSGSDTAYVQDSFHGQNHTAAPGSGDEALIASVKGLVGRDAKLADEQARAEEKAQLEKAQQEARIAQQKEAERKAKHERNRSIIRGIFGI